MLNFILVFTTRAFLFLVILLIIGYVYLFTDTEIENSSATTASNKQEKIEVLEQKIKDEAKAKLDSISNNQADAETKRTQTSLAQPINLRDLIKRDVSTFSKTELELLALQLSDNYVEFSSTPNGSYFPYFQIGKVIERELAAAGISKLSISFSVPASQRQDSGRIICEFVVFDQKSFNQFADLLNTSLEQDFHNIVRVKGKFVKLTKGKLSPEVKIYLEACQF